MRASSWASDPDRRVKAEANEKDAEEYVLEAVFVPTPLCVSYRVFHRQTCLRHLIHSKN